MKKTIIALASCLTMTSGGAFAKETTLTGVSCLPEKSYFSQRFEQLVSEVNKRGKGVVQINYIGGAPGIGDPFEVGKKIARGVFDIGSCSGAYYQSVMPLADAWKMLERSPADVRANGGWEYMTKLHREVGLVPLARTHFGAPFHLYLAEGHEISSTDLTGLRLRVVPIYANFFKAMGADTQQTSSTDIFPLMENGTLDGYGWPITGLAAGWEAVTKYRVDPGFYDVDIQYMANARAWDSLSQEARDLIMEVAMEQENRAAEVDAVEAAKAIEKQKEFGFKVIEFTGADREKWLAAARDAGWAGLVAINAGRAAKLRGFFAKE